MSPKSTHTKGLVPRVVLLGGREPLRVEPSGKILDLEECAFAENVGALDFSSSFLFLGQKVGSFTLLYASPKSCYVAMGPKQWANCLGLEYLKL